MHANEQARTPGAKKPQRSGAFAPGRPTPVGLLALQGAAGNAAVVQMLRAGGHPWAQEQHQHNAGCGRRQTERAAQPSVQRSAVHDVLRGGGRPLDDATRADMEARLGADFSDVRIHNDSAARASAAEVGARAYTSGSHVVIGEGGADGHTLAHELTHVIQQRRGPVAGTDNGTGLRVSDPSDRFEREAEATAGRVMASAPAGLRTDAVPAADGAATEHSSDTGTPVQRVAGGPLMQGYSRPNISAAATNEMLEYQGAGPNAPGSPRAQSRLAALQNPNPFDTDLANNWAANNRIGRDSNGDKMSRNHRLSDHYVGHIVESISNSYQQLGAQGLPIPQAARTAVYGFVTACVPSHNIQTVFAGLEQMAPNPNGGAFRSVVSDLSNNGRNLRAGNSSLNSGIGANFDPSLFASGGGTPITAGIEQAVMDLASAGVIPVHIATEALTPLRPDWTSSALR
ncbi:DUF4157 domain-containing protein [Streptomyces sp. NPDC006632]|uniref:eCIS core domain-containing protein n=1 Tax=Streptomyces sp. NPDC006632 TaxID=3157182 RepID=UPI0033AF4E0D